MAIRQWSELITKNAQDLHRQCNAISQYDVMCAVVNIKMHLACASTVKSKPPHFSPLNVIYFAFINTSHRGQQHTLHNNDLFKQAVSHILRSKTCSLRCFPRQDSSFALQQPNVLLSHCIGYALN
jgi:hypothetical protein